MKPEPQRHCLHMINLCTSYLSSESLSLNHFYKMFFLFISVLHPKKALWLSRYLSDPVEASAASSPTARCYPPLVGSLQVPWEDNMSKTADSWWLRYIWKSDRVSFPHTCVSITQMTEEEILNNTEVCVATFCSLWARTSDKYPTG